ncbi:hypothetical protein [Nostoc edaphicum]|nr:hypothetical protein [Nostoc edaphicum]
MSNQHCPNLCDYGCTTYTKKAIACLIADIKGDRSLLLCLNAKC